MRTDTNGMANDPLEEAPVPDLSEYARLAERFEEYRSDQLASPREVTGSMWLSAADAKTAQEACRFRANATDKVIAQALFDWGGSGQGVDDMLVAITHAQARAVLAALNGEKK